MEQNEITFLTPESVSVLYEALSTNTKAYIFHHEHHTDGQYSTKRNTKVTRNIDKLKKEGVIGYIDTKRFLLSRSVKDINLKHPKKHLHLREVKDVGKILNNLTLNFFFHSIEIERWFFHALNLMLKYVAWHL